MDEIKKERTMSTENEKNCRSIFTAAVDELKSKIECGFDKISDEYFGKNLNKNGEENNSEGNEAVNKNTFWHTIGELTGTTSGFTGFSECFILWAAINKLEHDLKVKFSAEELADDDPRSSSYIFKANHESTNINITRAIPIDHKKLLNISDEKKKEIRAMLGAEKLQAPRPDIAIFKNKKLIAVFSVKLNFENAGKDIDSIDAEIKKLRIWSGGEDIMFFLVLYNHSGLSEKRGRRNLDKFKTLLQTKEPEARIIDSKKNEETFKANFGDELWKDKKITLSEAVGKIVEKLKNE